MKRFLSVLVTAVLLLSVVPTGVISFSAYATEWYDKIYSKDEEGTTYVTPAYYYKVIDGEYGLSNIAATVVNLLGYKTPDKWDASMIEVK